MMARYFVFIGGERSDVEILTRVFSGCWRFRCRVDFAGVGVAVAGFCCVAGAAVLVGRCRRCGSRVSDSCFFSACWVWDDYFAVESSTHKYVRRETWHERNATSASFYEFRPFGHLQGVGPP